MRIWMRMRLREVGRGGRIELIGELGEVGEEWIWIGGGFVEIFGAYLGELVHGYNK